MFNKIVNIILNFFEGPILRKRRVSLGFRVGAPQLKRRENMPLEIEITNEQEIEIKLNPVTDTGKVAPLDGVPEWSILSGTSTLTAAPDGRSAVLRSSDDPGDTEILVKADADLGAAKEEVSDTIRLRVAGARAKNLGLVAGTPRAKSAAPA